MLYHIGKLFGCNEPVRINDVILKLIKKIYYLKYILFKNYIKIILQ